MKKKLFIMFSGIAFLSLFFGVTSGSVFVSDVSPDLSTFFEDKPYSRAVKAGGIYDNAYKMAQDQISVSQIQGLEHAADYMNKSSSGNCNITSSDLEDVIMIGYETMSDISSEYAILARDFSSSNGGTDSMSELLDADVDQEDRDLESESFVNACSKVLNCSSDTMGEDIQWFSDGKYSMSEKKKCIDMVNAYIDRAETSVSAYNGFLMQNVGDDIFWNGDTQDSPFDLIEDIQNIDKILFIGETQASERAFFDNENKGGDGLGDSGNLEKFGNSNGNFNESVSGSSPNIGDSTEYGNIDSNGSVSNELNSLEQVNNTQLPQSLQERGAIFEQKDTNPDSNKIITSLPTSNGIQNQICVDSVSNEDKAKIKNKLNETGLIFEPSIDDILSSLGEDAFALLNELSIKEIQQLLQKSGIQPFDSKDIQKAFDTLDILLSKCDANELEKQFNNVMKESVKGGDLLGSFVTMASSFSDLDLDEASTQGLCKCLQIADMAECDGLPFAEKQSCKNEKLLQKRECFCQPVELAWEMGSKSWGELKAAGLLSICPIEPRQQNVISRDEEANSFEGMVDIINNVIYELKNSGELFKHNEAEGAMDTTLKNVSFADIFSFDVVIRSKDLFVHDDKSDKEKSSEYKDENEDTKDVVYGSNDMGIETERQKYISAWDPNLEKAVEKPHLNLSDYNNSLMNAQSQYSIPNFDMDRIIKAYNQDSKFEILKSLNSFYKMNVNMWGQSYEAVLKFYNESKLFEKKIKSGN